MDADADLIIAIMSQMLDVVAVDAFVSGRTWPTTTPR